MASSTFERAAAGDPHRTDRVRAGHRSGRRGFVASLARPGGNITGFTNFEFGIGGKWLELLKEIAPRVTRVAVLRIRRCRRGRPIGSDRVRRAGSGWNCARSTCAMRRDRGSVAAFASGPNGGLIVAGERACVLHRDPIIALAARHRLPAVYPFRYFVDGGGLISYGTISVDLFRRAAGYVDRILKGEKPADLPVQAPTKYELVINLKTAKALGLDVPPTLLARADEVIE